ncbi:translation initiation factor IF-2 [Moraxella caviae]|uniref:Translation initiation factor IF-2 n=1 Tax=Moraxella caviae TaxID=34060 RepID=A0A1T0A9N2_9GAMM|nr:translation initiation factor IF-2 [Moraxella caviae]OOR92349.1 translation initiation factor IF-2 [Moraxella caviae]STZ10588.1 Translation initiation factor IF-2 [Moraxella caviae]VEW10951.1 Translation initiation factor IF-2 [Moraxella caviae]
MADKSVKELAKNSNTTAETILKQLVDAGLPARGADDTVSESEQERLVVFLKQSHGETQKSRISLKAKTTSTAQVTSTSGKAKTINVVKSKKKVFEKPDPAKIAEEIAAQAKAAEEARLKAAEEKQAAERAKKESADRQAAALAAMRASSQTSETSEARTAAAVVVKKKKDDEPKAEGKAEKAADKKKSAAKPAAAKTAKAETAEEKQARLAREAEEEKLRQMEAETRRKAAEEAQKRTLEQMKEMASRYSDKDDAASVIVRKDEPLAKGLVGAALEESFEKERREIKRGASTTSSRSKGGKRGKSQQEEREIRTKQRGLKSSQANKHKFEMPVEKIIYNVEVGESIVVSDLAAKMAVKVREVIKSLMKMGEMVRESDTIDQMTAALVVEEFGHNLVMVSDTKLEDDLQEAVDERSGNVQARPPVVTIMGHVDHGKTSLLDKIRTTKVASGEAGGITQHIGAYHVKTERGVITFLDTPGHAAFTAMRSRGAQATDIVVLVVAADDGMMPQTEEAIDHARAAGTPLIVAINKMDKDTADPDRVINELAVKEVVPEAWGGDVPMVQVSAKTGMGIDELLETISIQAEIMELEAPVDGAAQGVVIESRVDKGRGAVASLLVKKGTLNQGDLVLAGEYYGKVRAMTDENGNRIKHAGPSIPVEILGLPEAPAAGSEFLVVSDEKKAREVADFRAARERERVLERQNKMRLDTLFESMGNEVATLNIILKTDVRGSLEALLSALYELSTDEVKVRVISSGVGAITESDVILAESSEAVLLGFNVRADTAGKRKADEMSIDIRYYSVIYGLIDDVKAAMSGMLAPEHREQILGIAEVREVFRSSKFGAAAGCMVQEGTIHRNKPIRVLRDDKVIFTGQLQSLRRYKDDVNEVKAGMECGLAVKGYEVAVGDLIEVFEIHEVKREL